MKKHLLLFLFVLSIVVTMGCQPHFEKSTKYSVPSMAKQIDALLGKMTLEEKVGQMSQHSNPFDDQSARFDIEDETRKGNVGSFLNFADVTKRNKLQKIAVEESRLGIPLIFGYDVIHGQRTVFPVPLGEAASWDIELVEECAKVAAREARALGIDWTFSPMVDIARDPRWGRIVEGAGEDAYLGSAISRAKVRGYQGSDLSDPETVAACLKHFAVYGASQAGREYHSTEVPLRTIRNVYLPPFKAGVEEGAATLMTGFNDLNGVPATANKFLLTEVLRDEWGFEGFVVSDWTSVMELTYHGIARDKTEASVLASTAGVDMEMVSRTYMKNLPRLVREGKVSEEVLDRAVRSILSVKYRLGLFDNPYVDPELQKTVILTPENRALARKAVRESMVLLKNEGKLLPLKSNLKSIALIGPLADNQKDLLGTWAFGGNSKDVVTVAKGLQDALGDSCEINYAKGCETDGVSTEGFSEAIEAANKSDLVIMAVGESAQHNGETRSRSNLNMPGMQLELVKEVAKTGKPIVMILFSGRPLTINWELENIGSIILAWHPGIEGGNGIADVLSGRYNPAGKITVTFPRNVGQIPIYYNMKNTGRPAGKTGNASVYIDVANSALVPFGYGLSYTTFAYANLQIENTKVEIPGAVKVSVDVSNTGDVGGHEVTQLYIRDISGSVTRPVKELKGFERIYLNAGETKTVTFNLETSELKFYDINMEYNVEAGDFQVWVGPNSAEGLEGRFELF